MSEVVHNGETGYLVPQRDAAALAMAVIKMTKDRDAAIQMATRGQALVMEQFDPERCHGELLRLLKDLVKPRTAVAAPGSH
jgi:glycosyltransferase involved in cell wall biosynthesis